MVLKKFLFAKLFLFSLIFLTPLPNLGTDIYTPSLPTIIDVLNTNADLVKWSVLIYLMTYGLGQLIFGPLSDIIGRRKLLLASLFIFTLFSVMAAFSYSIEGLLIARFFQGLAVAVVSVLSKAMITDKYQKKSLSTASHYKVNAQMISIIFAPLIGGYIQLFLNWRWVFILLAIYGLICLVLSCLFLRETCKHRSLLSPKLVIKNFYLVFSHRGFMLMTLNTAILYAIVALFGLQGPFIVQSVLHFNSGIYGLTALCCGASYILGSRCSPKLSADSLFFIYSLLPIISSLVLIVWGFLNIKILILIIIPILFLMFSSGLVLPRIMRYTLGLFREQAGIASAVFGGFVMIGMSLILAVGSSFSDKIIFLGAFYLILFLSSIISLYHQKLYMSL